MTSQTPKRAHDEVGPGEARLLAIIEHQPMCLVRVAVDGTLLAVNEAALVMLGTDSLQKVLNTPFTRFVGDQDGCRRFIGQIADGTRGSLEVDFTGMTGSRSTVLLSGSPAPPSNGLNSALLTFRDVSEQRRLEQSLLDAAGAGPSVSERGASAAEAQARVADLERALTQSESRRLELEALLGERDGTSIDLDADPATPKAKGDSWRR